MCFEFVFEEHTALSGQELVSGNKKKASGIRDVKLDTEILLDKVSQGGQLLSGFMLDNARGLYVTHTMNNLSRFHFLF